MFATNYESSMSGSMGDPQPKAEHLPECSSNPEDDYWYKDEFWETFLPENMSDFLPEFLPVPKMSSAPEPVAMTTPEKVLRYRAAMTEKIRRQFPHLKRVLKVKSGQRQLILKSASNPYCV